MSWLYTLTSAIAAFVLSIIGLAAATHQAMPGVAVVAPGLPAHPQVRGVPRADATTQAIAPGARTASTANVVPCASYVAITNAPPSQHYDATDTVRVEFGETIIGRCISTLGPAASSVRITVNGVDRTSAFTFSPGDTSSGVAVAEALPLAVAGDSTRNVIIVTAEGYDANGQAATVADTAATVRYAGVEVVALGGPTTLTYQDHGDYRFVVRNRSWRSETYTRSCVAAGTLTCGSVTGAATKLLVAGQRDTLLVDAFAANAPGPGVVGLTAVGPTSDAGEDSTSVVAPIRLRVFSPALDQVNRAACPTAGAGPAAAVQCGHLLYAHGLPSYRSMGKARSLTMLHNSETARPMPMLTVEYLKLVGDATPDIVALRVARSAPAAPLVLDTAYYTLPSFAGSGVLQYRLVMPVDHDSVRRTGVHPVEATIYGRYNGVWNWTTPLGTTSTRLLVVNREASPFGAGWWPAGIERLHPNQPDGGAMLELPDGSAMHFRLVNGSYVAPPGERSRLEALPGGGFRRTSEDHRIAVTYDAQGRMQGVSDNSPTPNTASYWWTGARPDSLRDAGQAKVRFRFDAAGVRVSTPVTDSVRFLITGGNVTGIRDADGFVTQLTYQAGTRRLLTTAGRGTGTFRYTWDGLLLVDSLVPPAGAPRQFRAWQRDGGATIGANSEQSPAAATFDQPRFEVVQRRWPNGIEVIDRSIFTIHPTGAPLVAATPAGMTEVRRDSIGQVIFVRTPGGGRVWQQYDTTGLLTRTIAEVVPGPVGRDTVMRYDTTTYVWDPQWRVVTKIRNPMGDSTRIVYDTLGRRTHAIDGLGRTTEFHYTARGQVDTIWAPHPTQPSTREPLPSVSTYDVITGNPLTSGKGFNVTTYGYATGNPYDARRVTDGVGSTTEYLSDPAGRVLEVRQSGVLDNATRTTKYEYDDTNRRQTQVDPNGARSTTSMDAAGRVTQSCLRANWCETVEYEDQVNPVRTWDKRGIPAWTTFDGAGRPTKRVYLANGVGAERDSIFYEYDAAGNLTSVTNSYSTVRRDFDEYGRLTMEMQTLRALAPDTNQVNGSVKAYYRYDRNGRRVAMYLSSLGTENVKTCSQRPLLDGEVGPCRYPGRFIPTDSIAYGYDAVNLRTLTSTMWQTATGVGNNVWQWNYDLKDRLTTFNVPKVSGSFSVARQYDDQDDMVQYGPLPNYAAEVITRDAIGRMKSYDDGYINLHDYDALGQLKQVSGRPGIENQFTYDAAGNRTSDTTWTYVYDARGQLAEKRDGPGITACVIKSAYDGNGNLTRQGPENAGNCSDGTVRTMEYDAANKMVRHQFETTMGVTITRQYWYDGLGRRIIMRSDDASIYNTELGTWRYFWLDDHVIAQTRTGYDSTEYNFFAAPTLGRDGSGALQGRGQWFLYGPGMDNVLASWNREQTGDRRLLFADARGNIAVMTNEYGNVAGSATTYQPFGGGGTGASQPGYQGLSSNGGLVYMRNRWYDPNTGRFTQPDPIGFAGGINLYAYAGNDPVSYSDPYGLCPKDAGGDGATEGFDDCPEGSSGYYAHRDAQGKGGLLNDLKGAAASCAESTGCKVAAVAGGLGIAGMGIRALLARPALAAGAAAAAAPAAGMTAKIIDAVQKAGPGVDQRAAAVMQALPRGFTAIGSRLPDGGLMLQGGSGNSLRQVLMHTDGSTVVRAFNAASNTWTSTHIQP